ncbi:hypothetical protein AYI68_g6017, partial [Smittium mucronatum]
EPEHHHRSRSSRLEDREPDHFDGTTKSIQRAIYVASSPAMMYPPHSNHLGGGTAPTDLVASTSYNERYPDFKSKCWVNHAIGTERVDGERDDEVDDEWKLHSESPQLPDSELDNGPATSSDALGAIKSKTTEIFASTATSAKNMFVWVANKAEEIVTKPKVSLDDDHCGPRTATHSTGFNAFPPELAKQVGLSDEYPEYHPKRKSIDGLTLSDVAYHNEWESDIEVKERSVFNKSFGYGDMSMANSISEPKDGVYGMGYHQPESSSKPLVLSSYINTTANTASGIGNQGYYGVHKNEPLSRSDASKESDTRSDTMPGKIDTSNLNGEEYEYEIHQNSNSSKKQSNAYYKVETEDTFNGYKYLDSCKVDSNPWD